MTRSRKVPSRVSEKRRAKAAALFRFDRSHGRRFSIGADEAGRGCLAGPMVAASVAFDLEGMGRSQRMALSELDDSKRRDPAKRDELYEAVLGAAHSVSVSVVSPGEIDSFGLHESNLAALARCLADLSGVGEDRVLLVDGFALPALELEHEAVVKGDTTSAAIAAASVVAKVTRDRLMARADEAFPGWGFADHYGYSTDVHRDAIRERGICALHRRSFASTAYVQLELGETRGAA